MTVHEVHGWKDRRTQTAFSPVGVIVHDSGARSGRLDVIVEGRPDLAGPLANLFITKDGVVHLVSDGSCHHAGPGSSVVLAEVRKGIAPPANAAERDLDADIGGNRYFYGIEVQNVGDGIDPYPKAQIEALIESCVALRLLHPSWVGGCEIHHREWTPEKSDMAWDGDLRGEVNRRLAARTAVRTR